MDNLYSSYLRLFIYFPLVILLIVVVSRFITSRFTPSQQRGDRIYIVERAVIAPKTLLLVVRVGDEYILLSSGPGGVVFLKELGREGEEYTWPVEEESNTKLVKFEDIITSLRNKVSERK
jgi:flagellar biogenesis protein FliO